jgi:hypothetical protein
VADTTAKATNRRREGLGVLGFGAAACAACCAGPILGFLAAIGLTTAAGVALFGVVGLLVLVPGGLWLLRRRERQTSCSTPDGTVPVELGRR